MDSRRIMNSFSQWRVDVADYVRQDFHANPLRFCLEVLVWAISLGCSLTYALMVPDLPFVKLYMAYITACLIMSWCAYTRGSFGILGNYLIISIIDSIGLIRLLSHSS
jgi:hypothetical protein